MTTTADPQPMTIPPVVDEKTSIEPTPKHAEEPAVPATAVQGISTTTRVEPAKPTEPPSVEEENTCDKPVKRPFVGPLDESRPTPTPELTAEHQEKYDALLQTVSDWTKIPTKATKDAPLADITDDERMWLTRECLLRYLRATKWDSVEAPKRLLGTLTWRREYGLAEHTADYISPENETGKQVILGYDVNARPCLYLNPAKQNTKTSPRQVEHLVFMLERVIDLMVPRQETLSLLINFKESSSGSNPSVGQGRQVLNILQTHYPERLGRALVINCKLHP
jgi:hypothetical protein